MLSASICAVGVRSAIVGAQSRHRSSSSPLGTPRRQIRPELAIPRSHAADQAAAGDEVGDAVRADLALPFFRSAACSTTLPARVEGDRAT